MFICFYKTFWDYFFHVYDRIENINLSDSEENSTTTSVKKTTGNTEISAAGTSEMTSNENEKLDQVQSILKNHPGMFTLKPQHTNEVLCKACNKTINFADLREHVNLPIHKPYYQPPVSKVQAFPDIQSIHQSQPGVFQPSPIDEPTIWCNACAKSVNKRGLLRHLTLETHCRSANRILKREIDFRPVSEALADRTFSMYAKESSLYCNLCERKVSDKLFSLRQHVLSPEHITNKEKKERGIILRDFCNVIILKNQFKSKVLWCTKCQLSVTDGYSNVLKHIESANHIGKVVLNKDRIIKDDEFNEDLADFFTENRISFKRLKTMAPFLEKYTRRPMPSGSALRQKMSEKKKSRDDESQESRVLKVYDNVVYEVDEVEEDYGELEEVEVEEVQFPAEA